MATIDRVAGGVLGVLAILPAAFSNDLSTPIIGVQLTTIAGAVLGTYAAIGYDDAVRPRGKLFTRAISTTILAAALVGVVPRWMGWDWSTGVEGALAALAAVLIYYAMTPIVTRLREIIASFKLSDLWAFRKGSSPPADTPPTPPPGGNGADDK